LPLTFMSLLLLKSLIYRSTLAVHQMFSPKKLPANRSTQLGPPPQHSAQPGPKVLRSVGLLAMKPCLKMALPCQTSSP
jgi:hypothetical protein